MVDILDFIIGGAWFFPLLWFLCKLEKQCKKHFVWLRIFWFTISASRVPFEFLTWHRYLGSTKTFPIYYWSKPNTAKKSRMNYIHPIVMWRRQPSITFFFITWEQILNALKIQKLVIVGSCGEAFQVWSSGLRLFSAYTLDSAHPVLLLQR